VGRDTISDFTTNLIKHYLCTYSEEFAKKHIDAELCDTFAVTKAVFNYKTGALGHPSVRAPASGEGLRPAHPHLHAHQGRDVD